MNNDTLPWFLIHPRPQDIYLNGSYLTLDFETDNESFGSAIINSNDLALACWSIHRVGRPTIRKYKFGGIYDMADLLDDIASVDFIVCQNLKFELQWLKRCGLDLRSTLGYDTMLAAWVLDGNRKRPRDLNSLAKRYGIKGKLDVVSQLIELGVNVRDINPGWVLEYCDQDVNVTEQVFLKQREELSANNQWHLVHVRNMSCSVLADLEFEGLTLDEPQIKAEHAKAVDIVEDLGAKLAAMTGGINLGSPKQLGVYLYDTLGFEELRDRKGKPIRTAKDGRATSSPTLMKLVARTDEQREFLALYKEYNKQDSMLSKNLDFFKLVCDQRGGKFYGSIRQGVVPTGRLASSGMPILFDGEKKPKSVQLQNIPRPFKKFFWSGHEDYLIMEADSGQLEFRVAVEMGHDKTGLYEIESGVDIHQNTANVMTEAGQPTDRQGAKSISFAPLN